MENVIETRQLRKVYGQTTAVDGIDLTVPHGGVVAVLGPNGAGKSTLLELLIGLRAPTAGHALLFGAEPAQVRHRFGAMLQDSQAPEALTVAESVDLVSHYYPRRLPLPEVLERADLTAKASRKVGQLSGGQRQRLNYAMAIAGDPDLLFLDEPTAALDVAARLRFWEQVRDFADRGRTIVLSTHNMTEAQQLAGRVVLVHRGRIVADGTPAEVASAAVQTIRLRTGTPPSDLTELPGVHGVDREPDGRLLVRTNAPEEVLRALFAAGTDISDLTVSDIDLEAAFLHLVGQDPVGQDLVGQQPVDQDSPTAGQPASRIKETAR